MYSAQGIHINWKGWDPYVFLRGICTDRCNSYRWGLVGDWALSFEAQFRQYYESTSRPNHARCRENCVPHFAKILESVRTKKSDSQAKEESSCIVQRSNHIGPHVNHQCRT
jgi:hypothetical protein